MNQRITLKQNTKKQEKLWLSLNVITGNTPADCSDTERECLMLISNGLLLIIKQNRTE